MGTTGFGRRMITALYEAGGNLIDLTVQWHPLPRHPTGEACHPTPLRTSRVPAPKQRRGRDGYGAGVVNVVV